MIYSRNTILTLYFLFPQMAVSIVMELPYDKSLYTALNISAFSVAGKFEKGRSSIDPTESHPPRPPPHLQSWSAVSTS